MKQIYVIIICVIFIIILNKITKKQKVYKHKGGNILKQINL